jgi:hypothetical protein
MIPQDLLSGDRSKNVSPPSQANLATGNWEEGAPVQSTYGAEYQPYNRECTPTPTQAINYQAPPSPPPRLPLSSFLVSNSTLTDGLSAGTLAASGKLTAKNKFISTKWWDSTS